MSPWEVNVAILNSNQYFDGMSPQNNTSVVSNIYRRVLGREPDSDGLQAWLSWID